MFDLSRSRDRRNERCLRHSRNDVKATTAYVTMTRTELILAPEYCNFSKICFNPRRYFNQLDAISKVMY